MVDHDRVAVAAVRPSGVDYHTAVSRVDGVAGNAVVVESVMHRWIVVIPPQQTGVRGKLEGSASGKRRR